MVIKTPRQKKCKKEKWLSEEVLQIAEKRREAKGKGEGERYTQLNAEFWRIARRDKKALSEQCKEIEENNRIVYCRSCFGHQLFCCISLSTLYAESRVGKVQAKRPEEDARSVRNCRHIYSPLAGTTPGAADIT